MKDDAETPLPWALFAAELVGTAVLIAVGLSIVIVMFGAGSPLPQLIPSETLRRVITGLLFGSVGGLIAVSPVGRVSGAHINPAVTFGFWLMGKLDLRVGLGYVAAQLIGATIGAVPCLRGARSAGAWASARRCRGRATALWRRWPAKRLRHSASSWRSASSSAFASSGTSPRR